MRKNLLLKLFLLSLKILQTHHSESARARAQERKRKSESARARAQEHTSSTVLLHFFSPLLHLFDTSLTLFSLLLHFVYTSFTMPLHFFHTSLRVHFWNVVYIAQIIILAFCLSFGRKNSNYSKF